LTQLLIVDCYWWWQFGDPLVGIDDVIVIGDCWWRWYCWLCVVVIVIVIVVMTWPYYWLIVYWIWANLLLLEIGEPLLVTVIVIVVIVIVIGGERWRSLFIVVINCIVIIVDDWPLLTVVSDLVIVNWHLLLLLTIMTNDSIVDEMTHWL